MALGLGSVGRSEAQSDYQLVIRRALELADVDETAGGPVEPVSLSNLPREAVQEIADELGIPQAALAQALAEHSAGVNQDSSLAERVLGARFVSASHRCGFEEENAKQRLYSWFERGHGLRTRTTAEGLVVGHRRRGAVGRVSNTVRKARGEQGLSTSREVRAAVVSVGSNNTGLSVVADVSDQRAKSVAAGAVTTAGAAGVASIVLLFTPVGLIGLPVSVIAGFTVARLTHRSTVRRVKAEVEMTVDAVASGQQPAGVVASVVNRLRPKEF